MKLGHRTNAYLPVILTLFACLCASSVCAAGEDKSVPKAYSPFDEPRPKIPQEILDDKRLDQKVKVFVKSKNLHDLFGDLSTKTGVKITASRKLWAERPIIYFHKRPLRDVMTEVSGLYGYRWLISGKPGAYEYELFEDSRHAGRRDEVLKKLKKEQDDLLMELLGKCQDEEWLGKLAKSDPNVSSRLTRGGYMDTGKVLSQVGTVLLRRALADGSADSLFSDLTPQAQTAFVDWINQKNAEILEWCRQSGSTPPVFPTYTAADLAGITMRFKREAYEPFGMPRFWIMDNPDTDPAEHYFMMYFPGQAIKENDVRKALGKPVAEPITCDKPLPEEPKITADKVRWLAHNHSCISVGDVLQAIAEQSGVDVIADYYFQPNAYYVDPIAKTPLDKVVGKLCDDRDYVCQVDGSLLRFRYYPWFTQRLAEEPSRALIERCWKEIGDQGVLNLETMIDIACLPEKQLNWPGFRWIPYAPSVAYGVPILRMWRTLGPTLVAAAESENGLPASRLSSVQMDRLADWARSVPPKAELIGLEDSVIRIKYVERVDDEGGDYHELALKLPDGTEIKNHVSVLSALGEENRKGLIAQRKADAEADAIEVLQ